MATAGGAVPLAYGYNWVTGQRLQYYMLQNTGNSTLDYTRVGFWLLGEGEWDGLIEMWDNSLGRLLWTNEQQAPTELHFHPGCDAVIGSGQVPTSTGADQGADAFWSSLPSGLQVLHYNRWAYYAIRLKQLINDPPNTNQDDANVWADVSPIGLWRTMRCRQFDSSGAMVGYAFSRNPADHFVDLICRRKLFVEYNISPNVGPDDLPSAVRARFDWAAIADSAAYFDEVMSNGRPRFAGDYIFTQQSTLQACLTQILTNSRSFFRERSGRYSINADKPRASVFTFTRDNADSFTTTDADLHSSGNRFVGKFRDLLAPAFAQIASIEMPAYGQPVVTTQAPHSAVANDYIIIGGTDTAYDGYWQVASVPDADSVTQMTLVSKGTNYPSSVGAVGAVGFRYSRFHERAPQFEHHAMQRAKGAVGVGIPRQRNRQSVTTDFANCTWDQVARVSLYQRGVALGPDTTPYVSPVRATIKAPLFAADAAGSGAIAMQIEPGDVVTIDDTLNVTYAGTYEVTQTPVELTGSDASSSIQRTPVSGSVQLTLRPYDAANYPDDVSSNEPGWPDVPLLPGDATEVTSVPLADGSFAFFQGSAASGDSIQVPSGYTSANMLAWASPQGFIEADSHLHYIQDCDAYATRIVQLIYNDGSGSTWTGDVNWAAVAWRSTNSVTQTTIGGLTCVEMMLEGGELILFAKGIIASGTAIQLPDGYNASRAIMLAFPKSAGDTGNPSHGVAAWIDGNGVVHHHYQDGEGHQWEGPAQVFVFAWKNNLASWKIDANGWSYCALPSGKTLAVGGFSVFDPGCGGAQPTIYPATAPQLTLVASGGTVPAKLQMTSDSLRTMTGPNGFQIVDHPTHGVRQCSVDAALHSTCSFEDGEGNIWYGSSGVFGLLYDTPTGTLTGGSSGTGSGSSGSSGGSSSGGSGGSSGGGSGVSGGPINDPIGPSTQ